MGRSLDALSFLEPDRRFGEAVPGGRFPLELLGMSGTGNREPRGVRRAAAVGGRARPFQSGLRRGCSVPRCRAGCAPRGRAFSGRRRRSCAGLRRAPGSGAGIAAPPLRRAPGGCAVRGSRAAAPHRRSSPGAAAARAPFRRPRVRSRCRLRPGAARCSTVMRICLSRRRRYRLESPQACSSECC